ncbi:MAG TPA: class I SAM-dependent methyltransferase [Pseudomonadales bacterium]|nr:class I SAM-dependent methyltransferase [Pseudomonadales bacterium]
MSDRQQHWDKVYRDKDHTRVSWFQEDCATIVEEIIKLPLPKAGRILDVGGGASRLVDNLLAAGFSDLHVLDIAAGGLAISQHRLGELAAKVDWICGDITTAKLPTAIALWHDRAAFHFLTAPDDRRAYVEQMRRSLAPGGFVMLAAFAINGPEKCSDLKIEQYSSDKLLSQLGEDFVMLASDQRLHITPAGGQQLFQHGVFRFKG